MLVYYPWLKKFLHDHTPPMGEVVDGLMLHSFEIEGAESDVVDVDVLPNRAYDCLSHWGIAKEVAGISELSLPEIPEMKTVLSGEPVSVTVDTDLCSRYIGVRVEGVNITDATEWLTTGLGALDQRSISSVVDATNYCLLMYGQPLHAFDADKVAGGITVRMARDGEAMTTLDGTELTLDPSMIVIADDEGVLALAGIKGGKKAEVTHETKNLILEAALFDGVSVRKTSQKVGIRTDASKRFENGLAPELTRIGMEQLIDTIAELHPEASFSEMNDVYPHPSKEVEVETSLELISQKLGVELSGDKVCNLLARIGLETRVEDDMSVSKIPAFRLDLRIPEDIIEEVGRMYGYDKVPSVALPEVERAPHADVFEKMQYVRSQLASAGFTELYTPTFVESGEMKVANPLAQDRPFLRSNLTESMQERLEFNLQHMTFENEALKLFEVGTVFPEEVRLVAGVAHTKAKFHNKSDDLEEALKLFEGVDFTITKTDTSTVAEVVLEKIETKEYDLTPLIHDNVSYTPFSTYPRIVRDIALFVPEGVTPDHVMGVLDNKKTALCVTGPVLFDEFHKDGKVSLAFRMIFQSHKKTLSDDEVNAIMDDVYAEIGKRDGWETR